MTEIDSTETKEMLCEVADVTEFTRISPKKMGMEESEFTEVMVKWIRQCSDLIRKYCNNDFNNGTPEAVKNICLRLVSNMVSLNDARKNSHMVKVNDWSVQILSSNIFTDDLKEDLAPFKRDYSVASDNIDFFAITGDKLW